MTTTRMTITRHHHDLSSSFFFVGIMMLFLPMFVVDGFSVIVSDIHSGARIRRQPKSQLYMVSVLGDHNRNNDTTSSTTSTIPTTSSTSTTTTTTTTDVIQTPPPVAVPFFISSPRSPSPATVFGQPISDDMKKFNKQFIHSAKSYLFDVIFQGKAIERSYARFYALETIARMPYFSYLSVLHLFETFGWWRKAEYLRIHFAETWNELHHLLIMEELLGDDLSFQDRFVAQHVAFFYYWMVIGLYMVNPTHAYHLNQCVEEEAFETYDKFLNEHADYLQGQPAPKAAVDYYTGDDLYLFDSMHTHSDGGARTEQQQPIPRRPDCNTLYDTIKNIRDDEWEHVKTMAYLQEDDNNE